MFDSDIDRIFDESKAAFVSLVLMGGFRFKMEEMFS